MAVGRVTGAEQNAAGLGGVRIGHVFLVRARSASAREARLSITSVVHAVACVVLVRAARNHRVAQQLLFWRGGRADVRLGDIRSGGSDGRGVRLNTNVARPSPNSIDVTTRVPGGRGRNIFVSRIMAANQSLARAHTAMTRISLMSIVHDDGKSLLDICLISGNQFPIGVFARLKVRPQIFACSFVAAGPPSMNEGVGGKIGAPTRLIIRALRAAWDAEIKKLK